MEWLFITFDPLDMTHWEEVANNYFFLAAMGLLFLEFCRYTWQSRLSWQLAGDTLTNFVTLAMFIGLNLFVAAAYVTVFFVVYEHFSLMQIEITVASIIACVILADLAYYWEHRFVHRTGIGWATHTVHHSSPHFNISVAYRFGPLDGIFPLFFHLPLAALGFHPFLIFFAEMFVQLYQTALHTEAVRRLPRPIEWFMNTPSHHRVHHGSNPEYLDKNYGGIFIIWDRMFGTFAEEKAPVTYGLVTPVNSINPLVVFFHGFGRLARKAANAGSFANALRYLVLPPDWTHRPESEVIR